MCISKCICVCMCKYVCFMCVCTRASMLRYVRQNCFSKIWNNVNKFFIIRAKFYFKYFS